jgi:hypothetical protein
MIPYRDMKSKNHCKVQERDFSLLQSVETGPRDHQPPVQRVPGGGGNLDSEAAEA